MFYTFQLDQVANYRIVNSQVPTSIDLLFGFMSLINVEDEIF